MRTKSKSKKVAARSKKACSLPVPAGACSKKECAIPTFNADKRKKVVNADKVLTIVIMPRHVAEATCGDPTKCVIAQSLEEALPNGIFNGVAVGSNCTKIELHDRVVRYKTPYKLANALRTFDVTGHWHLPPGQYSLLPYKGAQRRWEKAKRRGGKQDTFARRISAPTRRIVNIRSMLAMSADKAA